MSPHVGPDRGKRATAEVGTLGNTERRHLLLQLLLQLQLQLLF